jgi:glycerol-3-phosphate acyltransferase PlsX
VGNVEGRDLLADEADVVVTDGFTGNVALKTLEGALRGIGGALIETLTGTPEALAASEPLMPALLGLYARLDPESTGGAILLGVDGVCIISHGSSSALAMVNAIRVAHDMVTGDVVGHISRAVRPPGA